MAKVLGQTGRYVSDELARQRRVILGVAFAVIALLGLLLGVILSGFLPLQQMDTWARLAMMSVAIIAIVTVDIWGEQKLDSAQRRSDAMMRGAAGEIMVGNILAGLPDDFQVLNDLSTPTGNINHVVIGPKGVFLLEAKNWRGVLAADGKGELLLNGRPTDKQEVRPYVERVTMVKAEVARRMPGMDVPFEAVFVFTAARIEAAWGSTGDVNCVRDDELQKYIVERKPANKSAVDLKPEEVEKLSGVFLELAQPGAQFSAAQPAEPEPDPKLKQESEVEQGGKLIF